MTKKRPFDRLFAQLQDIDDAKGNHLNTVLWSKQGDCSVILEIRNPVPRFCMDAEPYMQFCDVLANIVQSLGEGYALQKQDIFCKKGYHHDIPEDMEFLSKSYFRYFEGREYTDIRTFLIITQEATHNMFVSYDPKKWLDFHAKVSKVCDILKDKGIWCYKLNKTDVADYLHRFMAVNFKEGAYSVTNFKASDENLTIGDRAVRSYSLVDVDVIDMPTILKPYLPVPVNGFHIATDLFGFLTNVPFADCIIYNQVIQIPPQQKTKRKLESKSKRHGAMPDPSNKIAKADIDTVLNILAADNKLLVNTNFNIIVSCPLGKMGSVSSYIETKLYGCGMVPSRTAYNQLELFQASFPGNAFSFNPDYDLFLTLSDAALCLFFKEFTKQTELSPLLVYYTDRDGLPIGIDFTGKEGKIKHTSNANFLCIGPSGSGKSFHMNSVVRQLLIQDTDIVLVDTGDSYEGICRYYHGTYITYSKERPISMNPFKITRQEYENNFGEKKNFLKTLIFFIFMKEKEPSDVEELLINQVLVEYYDTYFHPFEGFTEQERANIIHLLTLKDKMNGEYEEFEEEMEKKFAEQEKQQTSETEQPSEPPLEEEEKKHQNKEKKRRWVEKLMNLANDSAASEGEVAAAENQLSRLTPEVMEGTYLMKLNEEVDRMEERRRKLKVTSLSFNSFYEFALERIPQICRDKDIDFRIKDFSAILGRFYKGGELEQTLNNDADEALFDQKFIIFEVDKIKDDAVLFPIVIMIIMDVFLQKMRLKKGRKAIIIEEAWKAVATPRMAAYLQFLFKTVRKFHGIAGVVTQELEDLLSSEILKQAVVAEAAVTILLDQNRFKDNYDEVAATLGITPVQRKQIFTINSLKNKEGRAYFREVWIRRGDTWDVFGVEEPPECYWAYTTERLEKEALKIYEAHYGDIISAIVEIERDRKKAKVGKYLDFARQVNNHQNVMSLWEKQESY